jgi:nitronate monooxygenase
MLETMFTKQAGIEVPLICGAMYPCSNPELIAAVSEAGGLGLIQPLSLVYVHGYDFREGVRKIRQLTQKPVGLNIIVEKSSSIYEERMRRYLEIALEEGVRFFTTALGNPSWVCKRVHPYGGIVYHDVTNRRWAEKALAEGVDGLICVNDRAGGHVGTLSLKALYDELAPLNLPLIAAGGIGNKEAFSEAILMGYAGALMGTRFIATVECAEKKDYKEAILSATEKDIIKTERITGTPLSIIKTEDSEHLAQPPGAILRFFLSHRFTKKWLRLFFSLRWLKKFKQTTLVGASSKDVWQAGKSVEGISEIMPAQEVVHSFRDHLLFRKKIL